MANEKPSFEELVSNLEELCTQLQALEWAFELKF
jgi:exonuclease VII small subunit